MTEYSMAKAAGEVLCADMNRFVRGLRVVVHRLPRLLTDQTATVMPAHSEDPVPVMLAAIRELHRSEP
jgi:nucleoside-diphosphate-sugar epimerase